MERTFVSDTPLNPPAPAAGGSFEDIDGERFYRITNLEAMAPFFMSLVSDSDHWLFISSNGALTAGRKDPDHALFPYYSDDRIHDSLDQTGSKTLLRVLQGGRASLWEPFSCRFEGLYRITRNLYKSVYGNRILFEEVNHDLGLSFRYEWMTSERFGFVRRSTLHNLGTGTLSVALVDGIQNVLPYGLGRRFQLELSTLGDGYKRTELLTPSGLALFRLSSIPVDKAEPSEALRVNTAWSVGLEAPVRLLSTEQLGAFRRGEPLQEETDVRGRRGAFLLNTTLALESGARKDWLIVAELSLDAVGVQALRKRLETDPDLRPEVLEDVERGTRNLVRIVAGADGLQASEDELSVWRHFSNTLFNAMRGGVPVEGYQVSREDLRRFLGCFNTGVAARHEGFVAALPETLPHGELLERAGALGDPDLERLVREYLPLTFSRRHGDPSRPWNIFSIRVRDSRGQRILDYQGNWRDIFQNWEALGHAYPGFLESMIFKFANASTADGHNPYRVMREGFDWEVIDHRDPWSFIGYWGDHQVIYLLKLLEASERFHPGRLQGFLDRRLFTYANVPYRIKPYEDLLTDPRHTITFDQEGHNQAMALAQELGADGKLLMGKDGPTRATLTEKLLLVALAKLANFIPEAGIWMNTQRPEWNDANNALVGPGVSMVTLYYLRRYLAFLARLFEAQGSREVQVSQEVATLLEAIATALEAGEAGLTGPASNGGRKALLDLLGRAGSDYRQAIYAHGFSGVQATLAMPRLMAFCASALRHLDHSIRANRREDGLYHAYNLMKVTPEGIEVRNLYEMLEGQVAVLSSGALGAEDALVLLDALRSSSLYRPDQASYLLYPDRPLPAFLEKNIIPEGAVSRSELLRTLLEAGDGRIVARDAEGQVHFNAAFRNADKLASALAELAQGPFGALAQTEGPQLVELFEEVFDHQSFTGRSGTFYKYEGLGCIYWHMVSKLLLAVDELLRDAAGGDATRFARLRDHYREIKEGLGVHKTPAAYGAIPTDPYSHTPGFAGVQQPGMTGQVKEDFLSRFSEMGVQVSGGQVRFLPWMVNPAEFLRQPGRFAYVDAAGEEHTLDLEKDSLAFTLCQVPILAHRVGGPRVLVRRSDGTTQTFPDLALDAATSAALFERTGAVRRIDLFLGL